MLQLLPTLVKNLHVLRDVANHTRTKAAFNDMKIMNVAVENIFHVMYVIKNLFKTYVLNLIYVQYIKL